MPTAAVVISLLVLRGSFSRIERLLMALATVFVAYIAAGFLAHPNWGEAARGLVVPTMPLNRDAIYLATATLGTTLAPWGLSFIQSYAVDKKLMPADLRFERIDVVTGALLTGVIGLFVVVSCAATLHASGTSIETAADAAQALEPLAGSAAATLFGVGLIGAAVLAAAVLPLSTAYSITEFTGSEAALNDSFTQARAFYLSYGAIIAIGAGLVLIPGAPLIAILVATQVLNAVLLLPLLAFMVAIARDRHLMGDFVAGRAATAVYLITLALIGVCVTALLLLG